MSPHSDARVPCKPRQAPEILKKGIDGCERFSKHRQEAVDKIGKKWCTLVVQFRCTKKLSGHVDTGAASSQGEGAKKKQAREDSDVKSPERPN